MIKVTKRNQIDVYDWDRLVIDTYNKTYCFQQQEGCQSRGIVSITIPYEHDDEDMNDNIPEVINDEKHMGVKFNTWLKRDPNQPLNPSDEELKACSYYWGEDKVKWGSSESHINLFWERNFYPHIQAVANDLHKRGLIPAGEYDIKIDW